MGSLRKVRLEGSEQIEYAPPPEALDYSGDILDVEIEALRAKAAQDLAGEEWELIEGFSATSTPA